MTGYNNMAPSFQFTHYANFLINVLFINVLFFFFFLINLFCCLIIEWTETSRCKLTAFVAGVVMPFAAIIVQIRLSRGRLFYCHFYSSVVKSKQHCHASSICCIYRLPIKDSSKNIWCTRGDFYWSVNFTTLALLFLKIS